MSVITAGTIDCLKGEPIAAIDAAALKLKRQIARYAKADRSALRKLAKMSSRHADIIITYPAAALMLARLSGPMIARAEALSLIADGAPLAAIEAALGLPCWLRMLPPEALTHPLPATGAVTDASSDSDFKRLIAPCAPSSFTRHERWMPLVHHARTRGGDRFAAWLGLRLKALHHIPTTLTEGGVELLALYADYSARGALVGHSPTPPPWTQKTGMGVALHCAQRWLFCVVLDLQMRQNAHIAPNGGGPTTTPALQNGLHFQRLCTAQDLYAEARLMRNCLPNYLGVAAMGRSWIFSVRGGDGKPIANVEVTPSGSAGQQALLRQMAGPNNASLREDTKEAIYAWFQTGQSAGAFVQAKASALHASAWRAWLGPYWRVHGSGRLTAPTPNIDTILFELQMISALLATERDFIARA
jgi:hypothetical protein